MKRFFNFVAGVFDGSFFELMNIEQLAVALDLQKRAYALLLWMGRERPSLLEAGALSTALSCERWLARNWNEFNSDVRPDLANLERFSHMVVSFFNSSFRIVSDRKGKRLVAGREYKDNRNKKFALGRAEKDARELRRLALLGLVENEVVFGENANVESVLDDEAHSENLNIWTYGCELVRRSEYESQGAAVHRLWLDLDENLRKRLSAERIWKARAQLVEALKGKNN